MITARGYRGTEYHASFDLDSMQVMEQPAICLRTLRKRVYAATTGLGHPPHVLAVSAAIAGLDCAMAAELFEVPVDGVAMAVRAAGCAT